MELNVNLFVGEPSSPKERPKTSNNPGRAGTLCLGNRRVLEGGPESVRAYNPERFNVRKRIFGPKKCNRPMKAISFHANCERLNEEMYEDWKTSDSSRQNNYRLLATDFTRSRLSKVVGKNYEHYDTGIEADYRSRRSKRRKSHRDYKEDFSVRGSERYVRVASYDILYPRGSKAKDWAPFSREGFLSRTHGEFDETFDRINDYYYQESSDSESLVLDPGSRIIPADHQSFSYNPRPEAVDRGRSQNVELFEIFESGSQEQKPSSYWIRHKNASPSDSKPYKDSKLQSCIKEPKRVEKQTFANDPGHNLKSFSGFEYESYPNSDPKAYKDSKLPSCFKEPKRVGKQTFANDPGNNVRSFSGFEYDSYPKSNPNAYKDSKLPSCIKEPKRVGRQTFPNDPGNNLKSSSGFEYESYPNSDSKAYMDTKLPSCIKEPKRVGNQTFANDPGHNLKSFSGFECESYPKSDSKAYKDSNLQSYIEEAKRVEKQTFANDPGHNFTSFSGFECESYPNSDSKAYKDSKLQSYIEEPKRVGKQTFANDPGHNLKSFSGFECESYPNVDKDSYRSKTNYIFSEDELKICNEVTEKTNWPMDVNYGIQDNFECDRAEEENRCKSFLPAKRSPNPIEIPTDHNSSKHDIVRVDDEFHQYSPISELVLSGTFSPNQSKGLSDMVPEKFLINQPAPQLSTSSEDEDHSNEIILSEESSGKASSRISDEEGKQDDNQPILEQTEVMEICLPAESESSSVNVVGDGETLNHRTENHGYQRGSHIDEHKPIEINLGLGSKLKLVETPEKEGQGYDDELIQYTPSQNTLTESDVISPLAPGCRGNEVESLGPAMVVSWDVISPKKSGNIEYASEMCYSHDIAGLKSVEYGIVTNESIDIVSKTKVRPHRWKYRGNPSNLLTVSKDRRRRSVGVTLGSNEGKCADNKDTVSQRRKSIGGIERTKGHYKYEKSDFMNCLKKTASARGLV